MRSSRLLLALAVSTSASGGCSALTGLDQIREQDCAPDCGERGLVLDADAHLTTGITDATALRLAQSGTVVDTLCYRYDAATLATLQDPAYGCPGTPADNSPRDDSASGASDVDESLRRAHCAHAGDDSADFAKQAPATPRSTLSPPEP